MSNDYKDSKFRELLDKLQQESWQLELLISGFAIFGLISAFPYLTYKVYIAQIGEQLYLKTILQIALISCTILIFNLLIHVILRGLWIGALGLRYVSGDIEFDKLNYQPKFTNYLKRKIVSFDRYVARLENYCSIMFAVSFLLIFYVISIFLAIIACALTANFIIQNNNLNETFRLILGITIFVCLGLGMLFVFIDFVTQGFLKKKKWLAKIYFPFYWVFSYLTLTFLYRPLVYNFLDNKFTRKVSLFLVPAYIAILFLVSFKNNNSNFLDKAKYVSSAYINSINYEDLLVEEDDLAKTATLQSKLIEKPYLKVFRVFSENVENSMYRYKPSLLPEKDERGFTTDVIKTSVSNFSYRERDSLVKNFLAVFNETHDVFIDSIYYKSDFLITKNKKNQFGFETYINIKNLKEGKHNMILKRKFTNGKDTLKRIEITIPFWYFNPKN